ncbi:MAG: PilZ domain-containing protein [Thermoanaerobaculia bacterium]
MYRQPHSGFNRVPFVQSCTVAGDGLETNCLVCNISILGVFLHLEAPLERRREVTLRFRVADDGPEIEAAAIVTWVNETPPEGPSGLPRGCGLRFARMAPDDLRRIAALIAAYIATPQTQAMAGVKQPSTGRARIPFITACTLSGRFGTRYGSLCNLSVLGVFVALEDTPSLGARGRVSFHLPGESDEFVADVRVCWQNPQYPARAQALPPGCGLCFENLEAKQEEVLRRVVSDYQQAVGSSAGSKP